MDQALVQRAVTGDHDAFEELARLVIGRLYRVARLILRNDASAEDATQEALVAAWRHIRGLRDPARFDAWLHRILINECRHQARERSRVGSLELTARALDVPQADASVALLDRDQLDRGFQRLDTDQRAVIVLHYYLGYSLDEAANVLAIPPGTARSRLNRATRAMRAALDADDRHQLAEGGRA